MYRPPSGPSESSQHPLTEEMVARYLTRKPNFVKRWFKDNASNDLINDCIQIKQQNEYLAKPRASVTHEMFNNIVQGHRTSRPSSTTRSPVVDYMNLNENELFFELIRDIANELNVDVVCHKILTNVSILTNSDRGSLFLARGPNDNRYLVSNYLMLQLVQHSNNHFIQKINKLLFHLEKELLDMLLQQRNILIFPMLTR